MYPPVMQRTTTQLHTNLHSSQLQGPEGVVLQPAPHNILRTGPKLDPSAAGTMSIERTPLTEGGRNARPREGPSRNRERDGGRQPLWSSDQNYGMTTPNSPGTGREVLPSQHNHTTSGNVPGPGPSSQTVCLRSTPQQALRQPRRQKQALKIASLNINGNGTVTDDKWGAVNNVMKVRRIAILAAQETHPTMEMQERLQKRFRNSLLFFHSADPEDPGS